MTNLLRDARFAVRTLLKTPGFTAAIVISVALGIAVTTTIFSVANGLFFGALPVKDPERLMSFSGNKSYSHPDYLDLRNQTAQVFEGEIAAHFPFLPASIGGGAKPERVWGQVVSGNYFSVVGVEPVLGRAILPSDDQVQGRDPVVVLGHALWQRHFGSDPNVVGRTVALSGNSYTVVGIAPAGFTGTERAMECDFWAPLSMAEQLMPDLNKLSTRSERKMSWLLLNARLKPGVSRMQAEVALNVVKSRLDDAYRKDKRDHRPLSLKTAGGLFGDLGRPAFGLTAVLMVLVSMVLLVACVNAANLLLTRAAERHKEIAIRLAMGASRSQLVRQLLVESILLSLVGAAGGFLLAAIAAAGISQVRLPLPIPLVFDFHANYRVLLFTAGLSIVTGILFGLAPALRATRPELVGALKNEFQALGRLRRISLRNALIVGQVALSLALLVGTGLFLRSLRNASSIDLGMKPENILLVTFDPKLNQYSREKTQQFLDQLRERTTAMPGVRSVSFVDSVPLSLVGTSYDFTTKSGAGQEQRVNTDTFNVGSGYWETMGIPLLRGRDFSRNQNDSRSVIINETLARRAFGNADPLGQQLEADDFGGKSLYTVIGVAKDSKSRTLGEEAQPAGYLFLEAEPDRAFSFLGISIVVKTAGTPNDLALPIVGEISRVDPNMAIVRTETMQEHVNRSLLIPKISATLLGVSGVVGLTLAAIGLYAVLSFSVRRRTREIGIRMALGARPGNVLGMIVRQGLTLTTIGLSIGLCAAIAIGRVAQSQLYGISGTDLTTFVVVPSVLLSTALVAIVIPALRASRVVPMTALRCE